MKRILVIAVILVLTYNVYSQQVFKDADCITVSSFLTGRGDTMVIQCDSVYLLNKKTFSIYQSAYEKWKGRDVNVRQVFSTYENLVELQSRRIEQQDLEYNQLKAQFDSLAFSSTIFIDKTGTKLGQLSNDLTKVNTNLNAAITQINEAQKLLAADRKKRIKNSIAFGAGGLTVGLLLGLVLN